MVCFIFHSNKSFIWDSNIWNSNQSNIVLYREICLFLKSSCTKTQWTWLRERPSIKTRFPIEFEPWEFRRSRESKLAYQPPLVPTALRKSEPTWTELWEQFNQLPNTCNVATFNGLDACLKFLEKFIYPRKPPPK